MLPWPSNSPALNFIEWGVLEQQVQSIVHLTTHRTVDMMLLPRTLSEVLWSPCFGGSELFGSGGVLHSVRQVSCVNIVADQCIITFYPKKATDLGDSNVNSFMVIIHTSFSSHF